MTDIKELARGRWREILPRFGIDAQYLNGKNGPCPMCALNGNGGIDRFRWTNYNNDGMWWCNGCSPSMGDGFDLACRMTGKVFVEIAKEINGMLGGLPEPKIMNQDEKIERARKRLNEINGKVVHASQVPEALTQSVSSSFHETFPPAPCTSNGSAPIRAQNAFTCFSILAAAVIIV